MTFPKKTCLALLSCLFMYSQTTAYASVSYQHVIHHDGVDVLLFMDGINLQDCTVYDVRERTKRVARLPMDAIANGSKIVVEGDSIYFLTEHQIVRMSPTSGKKEVLSAGWDSLDDLFYHEASKSFIVVGEIQSKNTISIVSGKERKAVTPLGMIGTYRRGILVGNSLLGMMSGETGLETYYFRYDCLRHSIEEYDSSQPLLTVMDGSLEIWPSKVVFSNRGVKFGSCMGGPPLLIIKYYQNSYVFITNAMVLCSHEGRVFREPTAPEYLVTREKDIVLTSKGPCMVHRDGNPDFDFILREGF